MQIPTTAIKRGMYLLLAPVRKASGDLGVNRAKMQVGRQKQASMGQGMAEMSSVRSPKPAPTWISAIAMPSSFCASNTQKCPNRGTPKAAVKASCTLNTLAVCSSKWVHIFYIKDGMKRFWTRWISAWLRDWIVLEKLHRALKGIV